MPKMAATSVALKSFPKSGKGSLFFITTPGINTRISFLFTQEILVIMVKKISYFGSGRSGILDTARKVSTE